MSGQPAEHLALVIARTRERIMKLRGDKNFNEQNTKASLIVPVLQALGWDTNESDEVHWEYKPKPKYNPVDFALLLQRTPCLFLEAKALRETLQEDKLAAQILTYATVAGVQWVVLTNGDEYRIYNANAPVPIEEKLFRKVTISTGEPSTVVATISLLSKRDLQDKRIGRLWESSFVDRQVGHALEELFDPAEPNRVLVRAVSTRLQGKLKESEIRASLRRARLALDFPEEPEAATAAAKPAAKLGTKRTSRESKASAPNLKGRSEVSLSVLIQEGILRAPVEIRSDYRKHNLSASIHLDGTVEFDGRRYESLSAAGGAARKPSYKGQWKGSLPPTNGWTFWQIKDPATGDFVALDTLRARLLQKRKEEGQRFSRK